MVGSIRWVVVRSCAFEPSIPYEGKVRSLGTRRGVGDRRVAQDYPLHGFGMPLRDQDRHANAGGSSRCLAVGSLRRIRPGWRGDRTRLFGQG